MPAPNPSRLDANQCIQGSFDEDTGSLRTTSNATVVNADIDVALDATEDNVEAWLVDEAGNPFTDANYVPVGQTTHDNLNLNANLQVNNADASNSNPVPASTVGLNPSGVPTVQKQAGDEPNNSTTTPLLAGATFTGAFTDSMGYNCIDISLKSDVNSAVDGVKIQFSNDGVTVVREQVTTYTAVSGGIYASFPTENRYFRFIYINGAIAQTQFIMEVHLHTEPQIAQTVPIGYPLQDTYSASLVRSIITGKSIDGAYTNQRADGISSLNSTTATLLAGATFTGTWEDVVGFANIAISLYSDVDSATDGLKIEFSNDGVTVHSDDVFTISGGTGKQYTFGVISPYVRIRYVNGASNQTTFNLATLYHISAIKPSSHRIDDSITGQHDAELSKAVITGKNPDGNFDNERVSGPSAVNTTTTPLGIGGVFTGTAVEVIDYSTVNINIFTDQDSATDGLEVQFSQDGTNWDHIHYFTISANVSRGYNLAAENKYVRVKYTNGAVAQGAFRLTVLLKTKAVSTSTYTLDDPLYGNLLAATSRSVLAGRQENGVFANVTVSDSNSLKVAVTDRPSEVRSRVKIQASIFATSLTAAATTIYTVTAGKTFYLESMITSTLNNANAIGEWRIADGATDKIGFLLGEKTAGVPATGGGTSPALPEPIPFTTAFNVKEISGDIVASIYIIGYEETN